ncbi:MAG: alpha-hydroxy acid oxidase [Rhodobacteraceae bacterium]|nr:alpha-hydroxy acid oxidase [Paracoccaceae bacterium]
MTVITNIDDLKRLYQRRVPRMFFDYTESGSWTEQTFRDNSEDFSHIKLRQRVGVDMTGRSTKSSMVGQEVSMPVALAPVGLTGMQCADGEIKAARAAAGFGVPFTLSTMSICSIEEVAAHATPGFWFQLYVMRDQEFVESLVGRARDAGCRALVLTLDLQILGQRHKDLKNGLSVPPRPTFGNLLNLSTKLRWGMGMLATKRKKFGNIIGHARGVTDTGSLMEWTANQFDQSLDWKRVVAIKRLWGGPLILKGILDVEDARRAADIGADAIIVSNHGGRQLDGAMSSIRMVSRIAQAVGGSVEIHFDSGIRSGQDVLKALAMGAHATYIGRSYIYGLGAMGEKGVRSALEVIHKELDFTMALCGKTDVTELSRSDLFLPADFETAWN